MFPEPLLQLIQSFLTEKEAAQTSVLSKQWYSAWSTRSKLELDQGRYRSREFEEFSTKRIQRYEELNLKVVSFKLRTVNNRNNYEFLANELTVKAIELGAMFLNLELHSTSTYTLVLPPEVIESETLLRLSVWGRKLVGNVKCLSLKSLSLRKVHIDDDLFMEIVTSCILLEELSLIRCTRSVDSCDVTFCLSEMNLSDHPKLRCLTLENVEIGTMFFIGIDSRFPCLKHLSVTRCCGYKVLQIHSSALETITFDLIRPLTAEFHVPNLSHFRYFGWSIPSISIQSSREWEYSISFLSARLIGRSWFQRLKYSFMTMSPSKISLHIKSAFTTQFKDVEEEEEDVRILVDEGKPLVLENVTIESHRIYVILVGLLSFCRPKFLTVYWHLPESCSFWKKNNMALDRVFKRLMKEVDEISPNCGIPDQDIFGVFGLKEVKVELYEEILTEWQPLLLNEPLDFSMAPEKKCVIRFQLSWL